MKIVVGVDIDEVLRDWIDEVNQTYLKYYPQYKSLIQYKPSTWNFFDSYKFDNSSKEEFLSEHSKEILLSAREIPGSREKLNWLVEQSKLKNFSVRLITKQRSEEAAEYTKEWLKQHKYYDKSFINVESFDEKWEYCNIMIDDSQDVLNSCPIYKTSIRVLKPYNINCKVDFTINSFSDLNEEILDTSLAVAKTKLLLY